MPRKHLVAAQTNKKQQQQAKIWLKLAKEIKAAAKVGGTNIEANPRLKAAVTKALQNNLSRESIEKNIKGASKDKDALEVLEFECYGPNGMQIIVSALTDNINRVTSNLRGYLSKINGTIAKQNSVKSFFDKNGYFIIAKDNLTSDSLLEMLMEYDIIDIIEQEDGFEIITTPNDFYKVKDALSSQGIELINAEIKLIAANTIEINDEATMTKIDRFIASCEDDDDIQWVVTNLV